MTIAFDLDGNLSNEEWDALTPEEKIGRIRDATLAQLESAINSDSPQLREAAYCTLRGRTILAGISFDNYITGRHYDLSKQGRPDLARELKNPAVVEQLRTRYEAWRLDVYLLNHRVTQGALTPEIIAKYAEGLRLNTQEEERLERELTSRASPSLRQKIADFFEGFARRKEKPLVTPDFILGTTSGILERNTNTVLASLKEARDMWHCSPASRRKATLEQIRHYCAAFADSDIGNLKAIVFHATEADPAASRRAVTATLRWRMATQEALNFIAERYAQELAQQVPAHSPKGHQLGRRQPAHIREGKQQSFRAEIDEAIAALDARGERVTGSAIAAEIGMSQPVFSTKIGRLGLRDYVRQASEADPQGRVA